MAIKNILCTYSGEQAQGAGLRHAVRLAEHHDAWLTGVIRHGRPVIAKRYVGQMPPELLEFIEKKDAEMIDTVGARFNEAASAAGRSGTSEFVDLDPDAGTNLSEFARNFDLIVTGHHANEATEMHLTANADLIALRSGRPVLVVPDGYEADGLAERALVAWDGKRAAARAIADAMEVLAEKAEVILLSVGDALPIQAEQMRLNLERHDVNVTTECRPKKGSVAETILRAAADHDANLIITGAYEHSKFTHDLLGGVTTEIQDKATVPVLMSH